MCVGLTAHAGFITGVIVGSAISDDSSSITKYPPDAIFIGKGNETFIICEYRDPSYCDEFYHVNTPRQTPKCEVWDTDSIYTRKKCVKYKMVNDWQAHNYTPDQYAKKHGYTKIIERGVYFRNDIKYHILKVSK